MARIQWFFIKSEPQNRRISNTRLPCVLRWVSVTIESWIELLTLPRISFKALRAGRMSKGGIALGLRSQFCEVGSRCHFYKLNRRRTLNSQYSIDNIQFPLTCLRQQAQIIPLTSPAANLRL
jgi:hypothetical protein